MHSSVVGVCAVVAAASACSLTGFDDLSGGPEPAGSDAGDADTNASTIDASRDAGDGGAPAPPCPTGRGPTMVLVTAGAAHFCIDSTEVTRDQYRAFLDSTDPRPATPPECAWDTSITPPEGSNDFSQGSLPIGKVSWCDAWAFCAWAGKRLCGALGSGAALSIAQADDPNASEWMAACTRAGTRPYCYGQAEDPSACNIGHDAGILAAGSSPKCVGGYDGILDMIGNVTEWENACDGKTAAGAGSCVDRGGSWVYDSARCSNASADDFNATATDWGIRCCADAR